MSIRMFVDKRNKTPMRHIQVKPFEASIQMSQSDIGTEFCGITRKVVAQVLDMQNEAIVDAVVRYARENGVDDIWLLDEKFVLDALREKMQRDAPVRPYLSNEHDISEYEEDHA